MKMALSRAIMAMTEACMGENRQGWCWAMRAEYHVAAADGRALPFAFGCLVAACREMATSVQGRFVLTTYALALGIVVPMAALQIGCAVFGFPYLYPGEHGLSGALLVGGSHEVLLRSIYQGAVPSLALIQMMTGVGHLRLAWLLVERDWPGALRWSMWTLAGATALVIFLGVLFLDSRQAMLQGGVIGLELFVLMAITRRHADLSSAGEAERAG